MENFAGYDASIVKIGNLFWMFVARRARGASTTDFLDLYASQSPLGPWHLHPSSPVVRDVRSARPAGRPFYRNHVWIRPAQDSSGGIYGRALRFQAIERIDETHYHERTLEMITPNHFEGIIGTHTFAHTDGLAVIDICRKAARGPLLKAFRPPLPAQLVLKASNLPK
jgi:hypothetical protein